MSATSTWGLKRRNADRKDPGLGGKRIAVAAVIAFGVTIVMTLAGSQPQGGQWGWLNWLVQTVWMLSLVAGTVLAASAAGVFPHRRTDGRAFAIAVGLAIAVVVLRGLGHLLAVATLGQAPQPHLPPVVVAVLEVLNAVARIVEVLAGCLIALGILDILSHQTRELPRADAE